MISLFVGIIGILSFIQSAERRTTQMEVRLEVVGKQIEELKIYMKQVNYRKWACFFVIIMVYWI